MIYIYKLTSPNGKIYIGQTCNIKKRFDAYKHDRCLQQPKLYNSLKKYGWCNFKNEIIESISDDFADTREKFWIKFYDCVGVGLNCDNGGNKNKHMSEETKTKISKSQKGRIFTKEHIRNMSIAQYNMSDENKINKKIKVSKAQTGKILSDITKEKMSKSHKGMIFTNEHKQNISNSKLGIKIQQNAKKLEIKLVKH